MRTHLLALGAVLGLASLNASAACSLKKYAELPVTMTNSQPLVSGQINGMDALFLADSGAFFSSITRDMAATYHLTLTELPMGMRMRGVGGGTDAKLGIARDFTLTGLFGARVFHHVEFVVFDSVPGAPNIIGQNVLGRNDTEYDLANGYIRLFHTEGCRGQVLAYWASNKPIGVERINYTTGASPHLIGEATLNGSKIRVLFDTGSWRSILTRKMAARAGVRPDGPGVEAAGLTRGVGPRPIETWIGRFDSLDIGGEQVQNAKLRFGDIDLFGDADMLLGADFFLSHRLFVAVSQREIYFTYNGGRVFDLSVSREKGVAARIGDAAAGNSDKGPTTQTGSVPAVDSGTEAAARIARPTRV